MEQGLKILIDTYWSSKGWKNGVINQDDFEIAKSQGYMFEYPKQQNHDKALFHLKQLVSKIDSADVANAFLFSLSTRKLEYRSALGSYYYAKSIPLHKQKSPHVICSVCNFHGFYKNPDEDERRQGLNCFNFERYKWGGVRHDHLDYTEFDLQQFLLLPKAKPTEEDIRLFLFILNLAKKIEPYQKIASYSKLITKNRIIKANKREIDILLDILGICDVFNSENHNGYLKSFTNADGSRDSVEHLNDYHYPTNMWRGSNGINYEAVHQVFGI